jgi:predicted Zn-dependent protease
MLKMTWNRAWVGRRLGDAAVTGLLVLTYLLTACDAPDRGRQERGVARAEPAPPPTVVSTAMVEDPKPATPPQPVEPTVTGPVTYEEAENAFRERRFEEALTLFTAYTDEKPENAWGQFMLGLSAWKSGEHAIAEAAFDAALERDPQHVKSLLGLGRVLIETGRAQEALEEIELAGQIDSSSQVFRLKGRALDELGLVDEAADAYLQGIARDDTDVWALNNLGYLYIRVGRTDAAIGPLARATELMPDNATFQNNLGIALERTGYAGSAVEAYRSALVADEGYEKARINLQRVESRGVDLDVTASLADMAQAFLDDVIAWRRPVVSAIEPEDVLPDSVAVPAPDPNW